MKRILKRGLYIMKAKGRHGTHSPFVYAFVEQVLRAKRTFPLKNNPDNSFTFSQKEINLLTRTFLYLNPAVIYADGALLPFLLALKANVATLHFETEVITQDEKEYQSDGLFFCLPTKENVQFLQARFAEKQYGAVIPRRQKGANFQKKRHPAQQEDKVSLENWEALVHLETVKMAMDVWYLGLLSNHSDFKMKQFFRLR
jgi:hypothetical protein